MTVSSERMQRFEFEQRKQRIRDELRQGYRNLKDALPDLDNKMITKPALLDRGESYFSRILTARHLTLLSCHVRLSNESHPGFGRTQRRAESTYREGGGRD